MVVFIIIVIVCHTKIFKCTLPIIWKYFSEKFISLIIFIVSTSKLVYRKNSMLNKKI